MIRTLTLPPAPTGWRRHAVRLARWLRRVGWWLESRASNRAQ